MPDRNATRWETFFGEAAAAFWLADGSIVVASWETAEVVTLYRLRGPGRAGRVGTIPLPIVRYDGSSLSRDGRRLTFVARRFYGDIWLERIASAP